MDKYLVPVQPHKVELFTDVSYIEIASNKLSTTSQTMTATLDCFVLVK